ncbi:MAG: hypothetical protein KF814_17220 [Nitrospiraceae bacterium]|nr:hypothetical protein [Nitrospiraceae bacterium]
MAEWLLLGMTACVWLVGLLVVKARVRLLREGRRAVGRVVRSKGDSGEPVIEFRDAGTNKLVRFQTTISNSHSVLEIESEVPVRYISGEGYLAEIDRPFNIWGFPILALTAGTFFLGMWWLIQLGYLGRS